MIVSFAKCISDLAKEAARVSKEKGVDISHCGKMCNECAFKWDQDRSLNYFIAADNAARQLINGGEFNCHTWNYKDAEKQCAGFAIVKSVFGDEQIELDKEDILKNNT